MGDMALSREWRDSGDKDEEEAGGGVSGGEVP